MKVNYSKGFRGFVRPTDRKHGGCRFAFTLAEVLITLGIIGVVAAMTMPILVNNIQKPIWSTALKKNYAAMTEGFKRMLLEDEVEELVGSHYFSGMGKAQCTIPADVDSAECASLWEGLSRHMKFAPIGVERTVPTSKMTGVANNLSYESGKKYLAMPSGMYILSGTFNRRASLGDAVRITESGGRMFAQQATFTLDINGPSNPNKLGRDIFSFHLANDGKIYPQNGKDHAIFHGSYGLMYWPGYNRCGRGINDASSVKTSTGEGCAARIMERGWVMDY